MSYQETLDEIDLRVDLDREGERIARFVIGVCSHLELSPTLRQALQVAGRYLDEAASDEALKEARVACWKSIEGRDGDLRDKEVAATRAVLCALSPRHSTGDEFLTLNLFEDFATSAGVEPDRLATALREAFAVVPGR